MRIHELAHFPLGDFNRGPNLVAFILSRFWMGPAHDVAETRPLKITLGPVLSSGLLVGISEDLRRSGICVLVISALSHRQMVRSTLLKTLEQVNCRHLTRGPLVENSLEGDVWAIVTVGRSVGLKMILPRVVFGARRISSEQDRLTLSLSRAHTDSQGSCMET